jgi:hypothetical protein
VTQLVFVKGKDLKNTAFLGRQRPDTIVQAWDRKRPIAPVESRQKNIQGQGSVGQGASGHAAVDGELSSADLDVKSHEAAQ